MTGTVTVGQLGCGYWGPNLLRNFSAQAGCHVKWVADQAPQRRAFVEANFPKTRATADWREVLADADVRGVIVSTPASTHYELTKAALKAGKHAFVEKPLALTTKEADELVALAAEAGKVLMVGHTFLYNPAVRHLKKLVDANELGELYYIYCQRLNLGQVRSDVNVWWNLAPHDVSILMHLMNDQLPATVAAHGLCYIQTQKNIEDVVFATLTWDNKVSAHIQVSWLDPGKVRKVTLVGSRKMVVYDDVSDDKLAVFDKGVDRVPRVGERMDYDQLDAYQLHHRTGDILLPRVEVREPLAVEAAHFVECVRDGKAPLTGPQHARDVVAVLEAGQRSLAEGGQPVRIKPAGAR